MATAEIRESQRELMARKRAAERDLVIPPVANPKRLAACEFDDCLWLRTYLPAVFYNEFTDDQRSIIAEVGQALRYGNSKCIAAPRGDGKSSITKYLTLKYALYRQIRFGLIICATGPKADGSLRSIKAKLRAPEGSPLHDDFPLECIVGRYVASAPAKANNVTINGGQRVHVEWSANQLILPTLADVEDIGPIITSLGYESEQLQGCNVYDIRPDFVMMDDLDSRESLAAVDGTIAGKIETIIDQNIGGLGGPGRRLGQVYLCTITSRASAAYKYSDPTQKASFSGVRMARIRKWPERVDLWEQYIELRQSGQNTRVNPDDTASPPIDPFGREAHAFLIEHFKEMHDGADLSNPFDFTADRLADGTSTHLSALQKCYDYIADKGMTSFLTEHQNDPPEESGPVESGITPHRIQRQLSGYPRKIIPPDCVKLTRGIDCRKVALHWVVRAWRSDGSGFTIDYGVHEVLGTTYGSDEGLDVALKRAILGYLESSEEYATAGGEIKQIDRTLIDAGWRTSAVYAACNEAGLGVSPVMGFGKSAGCVQANFSDIQRRTMDRKPGAGGNYFLSRKGDYWSGKLWLVCADTDHWKAWEHDRWMTAQGKPGCMTLFGEPSDRQERLSDDEKSHHSYARHICNEVEIEEPYKGTIRRRWKAKSENTHWLDASYYADVAAGMEGIRLLSQSQQAKVPSTERPTARQLAGRK